MKKRVLIVDDDVSIRESLKKVLDDGGYTVLLAADGEAAVRVLTDEKVDLLILDLEMPRLDGWDVFEGVRSRCPSLPVIMVTGLMTQLETRHIPGLDALLEKPIEVPTLLKKIEELLSEDPKGRQAKLEAQLLSGRGMSAGRPGYLTIVGPGWPGQS